MISRGEAPTRTVGEGREVLAGGGPGPFLSRSPLLRQSYDFAAAAHAGQRQESDGTPYIDHVVAVARLLQRGGFSDEVVAAGLLHDTVEHSGVKLDDLETRFGSEVSGLVTAMTEPDDPSDFRARKAAHRVRIADAGGDATAVFAADKIANVQTLRRAVADQGEERVVRRLSYPLDEKVEHYRRTLEMLEDQRLPLALVPLLRRELDNLDVTRSRASD